MQGVKYYVAIVLFVTNMLMYGTNIQMDVLSEIKGGISYHTINDNANNTNKNTSSLSSEGVEGSYHHTFRDTIKNELEQQISDNKISQRLEELDSSGLITEKKYDELKNEIVLLTNENERLVKSNSDLVGRLDNEREKAANEMNRINNEMEDLKKNVTMLRALVKMYEDKKKEERGDNSDMSTSMVDSTEMNNNKNNRNNESDGNDNASSPSSAGVEGPYHHALREEKCALLFFGVPKCFNQALLSIKKYILDINPKCDIYLHTYNISMLPGNPRNQENETKVNINEVYLLTNNVTMDTMEYFHEQRNVSYYRQYFPRSIGSWSYPISMDNMIKQWHSIESVWNYMESSTNQHYYDRVGLFRIDQIYQNRINISDGVAVIGDFNKNIADEDAFHVRNDRLFYGLYDYAKVWATQRFSYAFTYLNDRTLQRNRQGLHSETFLYYLTTNIIPVDIEFKPICARRIRNNCKRAVECLKVGNSRFG